jgi:SWI/SNF-related matrix-associated actin-dependent regulator of chromatin subfamily A3
MPGTISFHRYHGHGKSVGLLSLLQHDVVLTTYASIAADFCRGSSILHRIEWYRVVLDEGKISLSVAPISVLARN